MYEIFWYIKGLLPFQNTPCRCNCPHFPYKVLFVRGHMVTRILRTAKVRDGHSFVVTSEVSLIRTSDLIYVDRGHTQAIYISAGLLSSSLFAYDLKNVSCAIEIPRFLRLMFCNVRSGLRPSWIALQNLLWTTWDTMR